MTLDADQPHALDVLNQSRDLIELGQHQEALDALLWFHQHALMVDPALKGVRLSFALRDWLDLARDFPTAKEAYERTLGEKREALLSGKGTVQDFIDLCAMNERIGADQSTYTVFLEMLDSQPKLAEVCMPWALQAVLKARDFVLAKRIYGDPEVLIESILEDMHDQLSAASRLTKGTHQLDHACVAVAAHELKNVFDTFEAVDGAEKLELLHRRVRHLSKHTEYGDLLISTIWRD